MTPKTAGKRVAEGEVWVAIRLPDWARDELKALGRTEQRSMSWMARELVLTGLAARAAAATAREEQAP